GRQQEPEAAPANRTHDNEIGHETDRGPAEIGHAIGKKREQRGNEQKRWWVMPGEIALVALAEDRDLNLLLDIPIISQCGMAIEHEAAGRPHVDEIGRDSQAL